MKSETLVTALTSLTMGMAIAAPFVVFGFLYILLVQPKRVAALEARNELEVAREDLNRRRALVRSQAAGTVTSALEEFDARTAEGERPGEVAEVLTAILNSPAVGGVSKVSIATGSPVDDPVDSIAAFVPRKVMQTPVTLTFDARYEQVVRFFGNLGTMPTTYDLRSVELTRESASPPESVRAKVSLLVFHRPGAMASSRAPAKQTRPAAPPARTSAPAALPDPVVTGIMFSSGRRVALVDGRIVGPGDRLRVGVVRSIESNAVVITAPGGEDRRLEIQRPVIRKEKQ